jgi:hypothetical protein
MTNKLTQLDSELTAAYCGRFGPFHLGHEAVVHEMLTWGQPLTSFLWLANLRDTIVDPIEHTYGVSFSSLAIYPEWVDTTDNATVYALYYHLEYNRGDSMTLAKHGEVYFGKNSEYGTRYIKKEYN